MIARRLLFWSIAVLFPLPLVITYDELAREPDTLKFQIALGMVAYSWWLLSVVLSVRPAWLERVVGLPAIYGLHGMLGIAALALAYLHRSSLYSGDPLAILLGDVSFYVTLGVLCYSIFFLSGWLVDRVAVLLKAKRLLEPVVRHQVSLWIHRLNFAVIAMIWLHAHLLVRVNQYFGFMMLFDLYTVAALSLYVWKKWIAPDGFAAGEIVETSALGTTARHVRIRLDRTLEALTPGDFLFARVEGSRSVSREWHPFSVTGDERDAVTFTIRQTGDYTTALADVPVGTRVRLEGPFGRFGSTVARRANDRPLVLLGMGAGVAPLMSLIAAHHLTHQIHLLWSVRDEDDAYYRDLLDEQIAASGGQLDVRIRVGRFRRDDLTSAIPAAAIKKGSFFVVGPSPAVLSSQRVLRRIGVSRRRIHQERLTM